MRTVILSLMLLHLPIQAAESPREFPLWDGKETIEAYAAKVNLPPTKSLDLGNGIKLDLVLIPAGQFMMGATEPAKPNITVANANALCYFGGAASGLLLLALMIKALRNRKFSFSLRWLILMTIASGVLIGGITRRSMALRELEQYFSAMLLYDQTHSDEKPAHSVTLTQPFYMGKYTITQPQYQTVMGTNPSHFKGTQLPVDSVSWNDAHELCAKLSGILRTQALEARLPTEAQWEFACRAGTQTLFYSGNQLSDLDAIGWHIDNSGGTTHPVGSKPPNAFGLYDMQGNVWQFCQDAYSERYLTLPPTDPVNEAGSTRLVRGGSWDSTPDYCRASLRIHGEPDLRIDIDGIRVVVPGTGTP